MILNPSDPTGLGLFSKCARNQASKMKPHRPATAGRPKTAKSDDEHPRKKLITHIGFAKQQSRDQRQSKYKRDETPPVGQYNPLQKDKPKLVWDIMKVYHHQLHKKKQHTEPAKENPSTRQTKTVSAESIPTQIESQSQEVITLNQQENNMASLGEESPSMSSANRSQCMVNMSRMTGRKEKPVECLDWGDANVMHSVAYIKQNVSKNIYFSRQPKSAGRRYQTINPSSNYSYDYNILKPKHNGLLDFSNVRGRNEKDKTDNEYSYQHYEYNSYVWENSSQVFPNTKTHLIDFKKQANRYRDQLIQS